MNKFHESDFDQQYQKSRRLIVLTWSIGLLVWLGLGGGALYLAYRVLLYFNLLS